MAVAKGNSRHTITLPVGLAERLQKSVSGSSGIEIRGWGDESVEAGAEAPPEISPDLGLRSVVYPLHPRPVDSTLPTRPWAQPGEKPKNGGYGFDVVQVYLHDRCHAVSETSSRDQAVSRVVQHDRVEADSRQDDLHGICTAWRPMSLGNQRDASMTIARSLYDMEEKFGGRIRR
jgi:hypothetical protein